MTMMMMTHKKTQSDTVFVVNDDDTKTRRRLGLFKSKSTPIQETCTKPLRRSLGGRLSKLRLGRRNQRSGSDDSGLIAIILQEEEDNHLDDDVDFCVSTDTSTSEGEEQPENTYDDGACIKDCCGCKCQLSAALPKCCGCMDKRPRTLPTLDEKPRKGQRLQDLPRWANYCQVCRERCEEDSNQQS